MNVNPESVPCHIWRGACTARQRLVLGQVKVADKVADKLNEIIAIPALLAMIAIEGVIVTIDASAASTALSRKSSTKRPITCSPSRAIRLRLREDVELFAAEQRANGFKEPRSAATKPSMATRPHRNQNLTVFHDVAWLQDRHDWPGLKSCVMVESVREIRGSSPQTDKIERETCFYFVSLAWLAHQIGPVIHGHWAIEKQLALMDMMFRTTDHASAKITGQLSPPSNISPYNLVRRAPVKGQLYVSNAKSAPGPTTASHTS